MFKEGGMEINHVVIGSGEVGMAIQRLIARTENVIGTDVYTDLTMVKQKLSGPLKYLHIAIPYSDEFVSTCLKIKDLFKPEYIIVYSSVLPGTTEQLGDNAVHSPVEGRHPNLLESIATFPRLIAGKECKAIEKMFWDLEIKFSKTYADCKITELGKILSTTRYGINLIFAQDQQELCNKYGLDYDAVVVDYINSYNIGYRDIGQSRFCQQILTAPGDKIGGHCVIPNAKLLTKISDSKLIEQLSKYNKED